MDELAVKNEILKDGDGGSFRMINRRTGQYVCAAEGSMLLQTFFGDGMKLPTTFKEQFQKYYTVCRLSPFWDADGEDIWEHDYLSFTDASGKMQKMECVYHNNQFMFDISDTDNVDLNFEKYEFDTSRNRGYVSFTQLQLVDMLNARHTGRNDTKILFLQ